MNFHSCVVGYLPLGKVVVSCLPSIKMCALSTLLLSSPMCLYNLTWSTWSDINTKWLNQFRPVMSLSSPPHPDSLPSTTRHNMLVDWPHETTVNRRWTHGEIYLDGHFHALPSRRNGGCLCHDAIPVLFHPIRFMLHNRASTRKISLSNKPQVSCYLPILTLKKCTALTETPREYGTIRLDFSQPWTTQMGF